MKNLLILVALITGLVLGYSVESYRGKESHNQLQSMIVTNKKIDVEQKKIISALKQDLADIAERHRQELRKIDENHEKKLSEWQEFRGGLNETIKQQNRKLASSDREIIRLQKISGQSNGTEKEKKEKEIAQLQLERGKIKAELEGNQCLLTKIPTNVHSLLTIK